MTGHAGARCMDLASTRQAHPASPEASCFHTSLQTERHPLSTSTKPETTGSFAAILASIRPKTDVELSESLRSLIAAVKDTGKSGSLSVKFDVKLVNPGGSEVIFSDKITTNLPERNREGSIAYTDDLNNLSRRDPSSMPLFEEDVQDMPTYDAATGEVKDLD